MTSGKSKENTDKLDELLSFPLGDAFSEDPNVKTGKGTEPVEFSAEFYKKRRRIIRRYKRRPALIRVGRVLGRCAVFSAVVFTLAFLIVIGVSPLRFAVGEKIAAWHDAHASETQETRNTGDSGASGYPENIEKARVPTYVPEGIKSVQTLFSQDMLVMEYYQEEERVAFFRQRILTWGELHFDDVKIILLENGIEAILSEDRAENTMTLFWGDCEYAYFLVVFGSALDQEEMIRMANSVGCH